MSTFAGLEGATFAWGDSGEHGVAGPHTTDGCGGVEARGALAGTNENTCDVGMLTVTDTGEVGGMGGAGEGVADTGVVDNAAAAAGAGAGGGTCTGAGVGGASSAGGAESGLGGRLPSSPPSEVSSSPPFASPQPCA